MPVFAFVVLALVGQMNYVPESVLGLLKSRLVGTFRPALPYTRLLQMVDFEALRQQFCTRAKLGRPACARIN